MQLSIHGTDFGTFVCAEKILKKYPTANLRLFYKTGDEPEKGRLLHLVVAHKNEKWKEPDFWKTGFASILSGKTKFGRVGIFYDRKNFEVESWAKSLNPKNFEYAPTSKRRTEKTPKISFFPCPILKDFVTEGMSDSVEFRRLARKFIRNAKMQRCDTLFFPEIIFGEARTKKILQHLAGSQIRVCVSADFLPLEIWHEVAETARNIEISYQNENLEFLKLQTEKIMHTKLSEKNFFKKKRFP